ncbi:MAG: protein serine/threonine phosphatase, partial [Bacteroidetes bacterium]|nr:protein serine/threonine phosphatase [Bacteroidota bacterium]
MKNQWPLSCFAFLFAFFIANNFIVAQNPHIIDSLNRKLKEKNIHDSTRAYLHMALGDEYFTNEPVQSLLNCNKALQIAEKNIKTAKGQEKKTYSEIIFTAYNNSGYLYKIYGDIKKATDNYFKALNIAEQTGNYNGVASVASNIGIVYRANGNTEKAFEFYKKGLEAAIKSNNQAQIAQGYINYGRYYNSKKDTAAAMKYYRMALDIDLKLNNITATALLYNNIGFVYLNSEDYKRATYYFKKSLEIKIQSNDVPDIVMAYNNLGKVYLKRDKTDSAHYFYNIAESLQKKNKFPEYYGATLNGLYHTYKNKGNMAKALTYLENYKIYSDSLFNNSNKEELTKKEMQYDFEKKEAELKADQEKKEAVALAEGRKQKIILWSVFGILIIAICFSVYIFKIYKEKQKINIELGEKNHLINHQKELVEEKQKEIVESIQYAEQIQKTLIANHDFVNETIPDSFVLFKPKDIVSGDFYWAASVDKSKTETNAGLFYLAVCDSTGHGVPGAFMSLLNINYLNEAIKEKNILQPGKIFDHVRSRLIQTISQNGRQDGMDGILICLNKSTGTITYAAANNAPLLVSKGVVKHLPCDKMPVGIGTRTNSFNEHTFQINKGDVLYLFTDGYADQFGGPKGKKFKYRQLEELLLSIHEMPVQKQAQHLEQKFEEWKGSLEQVDDVCIIG